MCSCPRPPTSTEDLLEQRGAAVLAGRAGARRRRGAVATPRLLPVLRPRRQRRRLRRDGGLHRRLLQAPRRDVGGAGHLRASPSCASRPLARRAGARRIARGHVLPPRRAAVRARRAGRPAVRGLSRVGRAAARSSTSYADYQLLADIMDGFMPPGPGTAAIFLGGGVPKDFIQITATSVCALRGASEASPHLRRDPDHDRQHGLRRTRRRERGERVLLVGQGITGRRQRDGVRGRDDRAAAPLPGAARALRSRARPPGARGDRGDAAIGVGALIRPADQSDARGQIARARSRSSEPQPRRADLEMSPCGARQSRGVSRRVRTRRRSRRRRPPPAR